MRYALSINIPGFPGFLWFLTRLIRMLACVWHVAFRRIKTMTHRRIKTTYT